MEIHPPQALIDQIFDEFMPSVSIKALRPEDMEMENLAQALIDRRRTEFKQSIREVIERGCDPYGDGWEPEPPVDPDTFRQSPDENLEMARRYDLSSKDNLETRIEIRDSILRELFGEETE